jgi:hypothetical protein
VIQYKALLVYAPSAPQRGACTCTGTETSIGTLRKIKSTYPPTQQSSAISHRHSHDSHLHDPHRPRTRCTEAATHLHAHNKQHSTMREDTLWHASEEHPTAVSSTPTIRLSSCAKIAERMQHLHMFSSQHRGTCPEHSAHLALRSSRFPPVSRH